VIVSDGRGLERVVWVAASSWLGVFSRFRHTRKMLLRRATGAT